MRRTLILTLAVLACAVALCVAARAALNDAVAAALTLTRRAALAVDAGEAEDAEALLARLEACWRERSRPLALTSGHDALSDIAGAIAEARTHLRFGDSGDCLCALSAAERGLNRLRDEESLRWENLY